LLAERAAVAVEKYISGHCVDSMKSIICIIRANLFCTLLEAGLPIVRYIIISVQE